MRRSATLIVMLLVMLWQSVALARVGLTAGSQPEGGHATLHWQQEGHHHHGDGSFHLDDSKESAQHTLSDHVGASLAMAAPTPQNFSPLGSAAPGSAHGTAIPDPTFGGLLRPPRLRS